MADFKEELTVDEFLAARFELPESGQWSELSAGEPVHFQPPDLDHGNTVLNLSKRLSTHATTNRGYPCFNLGLILQRDPDTVIFPTVCYFLRDDSFEQYDREATETVPDLVIDLVSTSDRRRVRDGRMEALFAYGVAHLWLIDPQEGSMTVHSCHASTTPEQFGPSDVYHDREILEGFQLRIGELFAEPVWWS